MIRETLGGCEAFGMCARARREVERATASRLASTVACATSGCDCSVRVAYV